MGQGWHDLCAAMRADRTAPSLTAGTLLRLLVGLVLYAALIWLHPLGDRRGPPDLTRQVVPSSIRGFGLANRSNSA